MKNDHHKKNISLQVIKQLALICQTYPTPFQEGFRLFSSQIKLSRGTSNDPADNYSRTRCLESPLSRP